MKKIGILLDDLFATTLDFTRFIIEVLSAKFEFITRNNKPTTAFLVSESMEASVIKINKNNKELDLLKLVYNQKHCKGY